MAAPPIPAAFDTVQTALRFARVRVNDAIQSIQGDVLVDDAAFSQYTVNAAWRAMQDILAGLGFERMQNNGVIYNLPVVSAAPPNPVDPATQCWINWDQFFDGANYSTVAVLPRDLQSPLRVWERPTAQPGGQPGAFKEMDRCISNLPAVPKRYKNGLFLWLADALHIPGATVPTDLQLLYNCYLPDFMDMGPVLWSGAEIPIPRAGNALGWMIAYETCKPRGDMDASSFLDEATKACQALAGRDVLEGRMIRSFAEYSKRADTMTPGQTPAPTVKSS